MTTIAAVLFDLDGTLLDTLQDLADAANQTLTQQGFPSHAPDAYRYFVGEGVRRLFWQALPAEARDERTVACCAEQFREAYAACWHVHTRPYPGIPELLQALTQRGVSRAVLSNKPDHFTQLCVREKLGAFAFQAVWGQREGRPLKPDPTSAREVAAQLGLAPAQIVYLGDSGVDMQTAVAAGMYPVGALWGFRPREELTAGGARTVVQEPAELWPLLDRAIAD
jgi:phosphoglycolate phosphatase